MAVATELFCCSYTVPWIKNRNLVSQTYTKVCRRCERFYLRVQFARKVKITPLHLGIKMLITAISLEATIINYLHNILTLHEEGFIWRWSRFSKLPSYNT